MKWTYTISGDTLRSLIAERKYMEIVKTLEQMTTYILKKFEPFYDWEFEEFLDCLQNDIAMGENGITSFITEEPLYDTLEEYIDSLLNWFYDLCDKERIWVTL